MINFDGVYTDAITDDNGLFFNSFGRNNNATKNLVAMITIVFVVVKFRDDDLGYFVWFGFDDSSIYS